MIRKFNKQQLLLRGLILALLAWAISWVVPGMQLKYVLAGIVVAYAYLLSFIWISIRWQNPALVVFSLMRIMLFGYLIGGVIAPEPAKLVFVLSGFFVYLLYLFVEAVLWPVLKAQTAIGTTSRSTDEY